jgi:predicted Zn-dependent protease
MKMNVGNAILLTLFFLGMIAAQAQEEESAELYLEEYTDEFQDRFFEALKQKGIENYDRAENLLLECKQIEPEISTIDHELAKVYLAQKDLVAALEYCIVALATQPDNYWYANTFIEILQRQGQKASAYSQRIPYQDKNLKQNLALIYYKRRDYKAALLILKELEVSNFTTDLTSKIKDSIDLASNTMASKKASNEKKAEPEDPLAQHKERFEDLLSRKEFAKLETAAGEALELYPSQPYFYYMMGKALALNNKNKQAARLLESALDFMLDDTALNNDIYRELASVYKALGNLEKSNLYFSKIKNGS